MGFLIGAGGGRSTHRCVLILHGTADAEIPVENAQRLSSLIPAPKVELFDDAGSSALVEDPDRTTTPLVTHTTA
jgi:pimeloyl-ACP methyl ester carboxylesterase